MPVHLDPNGFANQLFLGNIPKYDYTYPNDLDLRPESELHRKLVGKIYRRATESRAAMSARWDEWRRTDRVLRAYVSPDWEKQQRELELKNYDTALPLPKFIMPTTFANMQTLLTYQVAAFMQDPIWRYEGTGPEDMIGSLLMEKLIQQQVVKGRAGLALHTMFRDGYAYGIAPVAVSWERRRGRRPRREDDGFFSALRNLFIKTGERKTIEDVIVYEGNKLHNIDPYRFLPDPSAPAGDIDRAGYAGWIEDTTVHGLLTRERDPSDYLFNVKYLKHFDPKSTLAIEDTSGRESLYQGTNIYGTTKKADVIWMYINIIPKDWQLSKREYPEWWLFGLAGDKVIVAARPVGLDHDMIPLVTAAPDFDGHSTSPASRMGIISDQQVLIDFLVTSHFENIRKSVNNQWLVDPSIVNIYDVNDPRPGKIMRIRRAHWGKANLEAAMKQFDVRDVTQNHMFDAGLMFEFMQRGTGSTDSIAGIMQRRSARISSAEFQGTASNALSRLEKDARMISIQAMQPLGMLMAANVQELMTEETYVKAVGTWVEKLTQDYGYSQDKIVNERIPVTPLDMLVAYDLVAHDGSIPGSQNIDAWLQAYQIAAQNPAVSQNLDMTRLALHIFRELGAKNIDAFLRTGVNPLQVMPDEQVDAQVQQGNLVPYGGDGLA